MFFQNVTRFILISNTIYIEWLVFLPCPITMGKGLGLGVYLAKMAAAVPFTVFAKFAKRFACKDGVFPVGALKQRLISHKNTLPLPKLLPTLPFVDL